MTAQTLPLGLIAHGADHGAQHDSAQQDGAQHSCRCQQVCLVALIGSRRQQPVMIAIRRVRPVKSKVRRRVKSWPRALTLGNQKRQSPIKVGILPGTVRGFGLSAALGKC